LVLVSDYVGNVEGEGAFLDYLANIKKVMTARKVLVQELAKKLDKSPQYVYHKLNGIRRFTVDELLDWCRVLDITADIVFMDLGEGPELDEFLDNIMWVKNLPAAQRRRFLKLGVMVYREMIERQPGDLGLNLINHKPIKT
jgi:transcriptional regulator with XRE-family HTH domain